jgi:ribonuclease J
LNIHNPSDSDRNRTPEQQKEVSIADAGEVLKPNHQRPANKNNQRKNNRNRHQGANNHSQNRSRPAGPKKMRRNKPLPPRRISLTENKRDEKSKLIRRAPTENLRIIPLGGSKEVGEKNMLVFEYGNDIIVIDAGLQFPDASMPGIDYIIPDTTYLEENKDRIRAFVVTHGHEDHIGGFPYIWPKFPVPIYTAPLTAGFIKAKFEEHGVTDAEFRIINPGDKVQIGAFTVEPVRMTHSIPDILGLAITTPIGLVYHATDWRIDMNPPFGEPTDFAKLTELSQRGILCLLSDSTNVMVEGHTLSEQIIGKTIEDIFAASKGRVIVSSFSSRIDRIQHVVTACAKTGRHLALSGRSMERNANIAMELGYLKAPKGVLVDIRTVNNLPDDKIVVMCTGSQGEEFSALVRMALGEHRHIKIKKGDTVVLSASPVPGNERGIDNTINNLYREGAEVITNKKLDVHSSGHAHIEEIKIMLNLLKPKYLIPIHGDYRRFVEHIKLAEQCGMKPGNGLILENGRIVEFDKSGEGKITDERVPVGQVLIDGSGVGDVGEIVLRDRQTMAKDGLFMVILTVNGQSGKLMSSPDIISRGFVYMRESEELINGARGIARRLHSQALSKKTRNWDNFKRQLRDEMTDYLYQKTQRSPMVITVVVNVHGNSGKKTTS